MRPRRCSATPGAGHHHRHQSGRRGLRHWTRPHPPLYIGGGSLATARRAARYRLPLSLADHLPHVAALYRKLAVEQRSLMHLPGVQTLDEVRASGRYRFLTPNQLIAEVRDTPAYGPIVLHPLVGGMPVEQAWKSVELFVDEVIPALQ